MDQDIRFQLPLAASASASATAYFNVPYECVLRDVGVTAQVATSIKSSGSTLSCAVTETSASTSLGTLAVSGSNGSVAAGAGGTYTPDGSSGSTVLSASTTLKFNIVQASAVNAAMNFLLDVELDPYARSL